MCPHLSANYVSSCPPNMAQVSVWAGNLQRKRKKADSVQKADANDTPAELTKEQMEEQQKEEIAVKVECRLNRIPFYPKEWKDSFGLPVKEHERALETYLKEGYVEFSTTM